MRIRSSVMPTPIVSQPPPQQHSQPAEAPPAPAPVHIQTEPLVVNLGDKQIHLQPGELPKVVEKMNQTARVFNQSLQFEISERSDKIVIRVIDTASGQVVREIPPEKLVDAFSQMEDALGLLLDLKL